MKNSTQKEHRPLQTEDRTQNLHAGEETVLLTVGLATIYKLFEIAVNCNLMVEVGK